MEKTLKNLSKAFIGESQARNRYAIYAKVAKKEGYEQVSAIFEETADQEREHAKWLMRHINEIQDKLGRNEEILVDAGVPTVMGSTAENLNAAMEGEHHEHSSMYPDFADIADEEGLPHVATRLKAIAKAESHHEERYRSLLENLEASTLFRKSEVTYWVCRKCGYQHTGLEAPKECPACGHPQAYYQQKCENY